jgi:hypothetical protein
MIQGRIQAAISWVEKVCNRHFQLQEYDEMYMIGLDGDVVLENFPIVQITRTMCDLLTIGPLTIQGPASASSASFAISNPTNPISASGSQLALTTMISGVRTDTVLSFATYPTLGQLVTAINALGFTATLGQYQTTACQDLVPQFGAVGNGGLITCYAWMDYNGPQYYWERYGTVRWLPRGLGMRFVYTGGFANVPEEIKQVAAHLAMQDYTSPDGKVKTELLGQYSYTLFDPDKLAISDRKVLSYYRNRRQYSYNP